MYRNSNSQTNVAADYAKCVVVEHGDFNERVRIRGLRVAAHAIDRIDTGE